MKRLKLLLVIALAVIPMMPIQAGHPMKCDPEQGAPCNMKSCAHLAKKQQWCSPKCHKDCCKCPTEGINSCNGHAPERGQDDPEAERIRVSPNQHQEWWPDVDLASGRVD